MRRLFLGLCLVAFLVQGAAAPKEQYRLTRIAKLEGEPLQLQWDALAGSLLISLRTVDNIRHYHLRPGDTLLQEITFPAQPLWITPHPANKAWAGASESGNPWYAGDYRFLSRFPRRKIVLQQPAFNSAGNLLAMSGQTPYEQLWRLITYDLKYDNLNVMTHLPGGVAYPNWSPKGSYLAFVLPTDHPFRKSVGTVRWDGTGFQLLASDSLSFEFASWPDSEQYLLITAKGQTHWKLMRRHLSSGGWTELFESESELRFALWIPRMRKIALLKKEDSAWWLCLLEEAE
ncbi:MAG: hypothetical protein IPM52_05285 [Bacteroidetes bacterium]|nr:hypothetical protein [Bacteroidota bacterium]